MSLVLYVGGVSILIRVKITCKTGKSNKEMPDGFNIDNGQTMEKPI